MAPFADAFKKFVSFSPDARPADPAQTASSSPKNSANQKALVVAVVLVLIVAGALFALRTIQSNIRAVAVTPNDPNLVKTVKPESDKSSMLNSLESEFSRQKLESDSVPEDISLIAKKWDYKPQGNEKRTKLAQPVPVVAPQSPPTPPTPQPAVSSVPVVVNPAPVVHSSKHLGKHRGKEKPTQRDELASIDDPFNTVHASSTGIGGSSAVTAASASLAAPSSRQSATSDVRYIPAVIYGNQKIRTGGKARFRVTEAVTFMGIHIPRNTILSAIAYLGAGRLQFQMPAPMVAGQWLPVDLMCLDKDYTMGITFNYDVVEDNIRQTSGNTASEVANAATSAMSYGGVVGQIGSSAIRGVASAFTNGKRQRTISEVEILDGYHVFFKSTKN